MLPYHLTAHNTMSCHSRDVLKNIFPYFLVPVGLSECETNPCRNGGTCYSVDDIQTFRCHCASGFKGTHCQGKDC
jgi:hypothetical protein